MNKHRSIRLLTPFLLLAMPAAALAQPALEGSWTLALGKKAPCQVNIAADGTVSPASDCPAAIARWKSTLGGLQLQTASGETFAVLKAKGDGFRGTALTDLRDVTLSR